MSNIFSMIATIGSGVQSSKAYKAKALGAEIEQKMALLRGTQIGERSREDLQTALGNIDSIRSARGASLDSQTGQMIEKRTMRDAYRDEGVQVLSELTRAGAAEQARLGYRKSASWAVPLAVLNSVGDFASAASYGMGGAAKAGGAGGAKGVARFDNGGSGRIGTEMIYGSGKGR